MVAAGALGMRERGGVPVGVPHAARASGGGVPAETGPLCRPMPGAEDGPQFCPAGVATPDAGADRGAFRLEEPRNPWRGGRPAPGFGAGFA